MSVERLEAFMHAAVYDQPEARRLLASFPALLNARTLNGESVLHFLAIEGYTEGVRFLLQAGAQVDTTNVFGDTPLVDVTVLGNMTIARELLAHGADPNARSQTRDNVVHVAAGSGNSELLDAILSAGGRTDYVTDLGQTVWDAIERQPTELALMQHVLTKHGARRPTTT